MDRASRRSRIAARLDDLGADAFLATRPPNVRYLTGFTGSNGQLLVTENDAVFLTDGRYGEASRAEVPDLPARVYSGGMVDAAVDACHELGIRRLAFEADGVTFRTWSGLREQDLDLVPATREIERLRRSKDPDEVDLIARAQAVADEVFASIMTKLSEGMTERALAFELDSCVRRASAEGAAFDAIVAFGPGAAEPHHHPTDRPLARGDVVKIDFGAVVDGYHSDMTRTVAFGEPPARLREVHDVVRAAQEAGVQAARPGITAGRLDAVVRTLIRDAGYDHAFGHPLGHGVGLEVHEDPFLRAGSDEILAAGEVITIEPGVYLPGEGGVRIEDMVVLDAQGCRVLPRTPKDLILL